MIREIALNPVFGVPAVAYGGVIALLLLLFTALISYSNSIGKPVLPFKWHPRFAVLTILVAIVHGFLGLSIFLGY